MFLKTQAFFENSIPGNNALLIRAETELPAAFIRRYKANVIPLTPARSGALRRSIITRQVGNTAEVSWRSPYAGAQNQGYHTDRSVHFAPAKGYGSNDQGFMTSPGTRHYYRHYTTAGTGPHFANTAYKRTVSEIPSIIREMGLIK